MDTKNASNIGIKKNYKILPSRRQKKKEHRILLLYHLWMYNVIFTFQFVSYGILWPYIHDISRSMHSLKYNKLSSLYTHRPHNLWQFVCKLCHSLNSAPKNIYLFDIHQIIWTVHARELFYESSHHDAMRLVDIMNGLRQSIVSCSSNTLPYVITTIHGTELVKNGDKLVYIAAKYSFI